MNAPMRFENTRVWWIKTCKPYNFSFENRHQQPNVAFGTTKVAMSSALTLELTGTLAALKKKYFILPITALTNRRFSRKPSRPLRRLHSWMSRMVWATEVATQILLSTNVAMVHLWPRLSSALRIAIAGADKRHTIARGDRGRLCSCRFGPSLAVVLNPSELLKPNMLAGRQDRLRTSHTRKHWTARSGTTWPKAFARSIQAKAAASKAWKL